ncbi:MAG: hypothetical protein LBP72_08080, partial [Dysgonamonadaceae bacterium]|nr:hypothetical protein [Dysgonamonadaceae bacterium]
MILKGTTPIQAIKLGSADVQRVMYNGAKIWPGDTEGEIIFEVTTTVNNENVPLVVLRSDNSLIYTIDFGDGNSDVFTTLSSNNGTTSNAGIDTDGDGIADYFETTFIGNSGAITHTYPTAGTYTVVVRFGGDVSNIVFAPGFYNQAGEWISMPVDNPYITKMKKFKSESISSLNQTFAGLVNCRHDDDFVLETPLVTSAWAAFMNYGAGVYNADELWALKPALFSQINKQGFSPRGLDETFRQSGFTNIERRLLEGFTTLTGLFETFRQMTNLGKNWYAKNNTANAYAESVYPALHPSAGTGLVNPDTVLENDKSYIPVDLLWYSPNLSTIEGLFNATHDDHGSMSPNGRSYRPPVRREFFWNGKSAGNQSGTLTNINLCFYKHNRIIFDTDIFAYVKNTLRSARGTFAATYQSGVDLQFNQCMQFFTHDIAEIMGFTKGTNINYQEPDKTSTVAGDRSTGIPNREYAYTPAEMIALFPNLENIDMLFGGEGQASSFNQDY